MTITVTANGKPASWVNPIVIKGQPYIIESSNQEYNLDGNRLWPCSIALAERVAEIKDATLCFLGDGLGLPSIVASKNNNIVTLIERDSRLFESIYNNYNANNTWAKFRVADWSRQIDEGTGFDAIYGSEIIYNSYNIPGLVKFIKTNWNKKLPCMFLTSLDNSREAFMDECKLAGLEVGYALLDSQYLPEPCHYYVVSPNVLAS